MLATVRWTSFALTAALALRVAPAAAQAPSTWSYRSATGRAESGAISAQGTYAGGTLLDPACAYAVNTLDPGSGAQGSFDCAAGAVRATSFASTARTMCGSRHQASTGTTVKPLGGRYSAGSVANT